MLELMHAVLRALALAWVCVGFLACQRSPAGRQDDAGADAGATEQIQCVVSDAIHSDFLVVVNSYGWESQALDEAAARLSLLPRWLISGNLWGSSRIAVISGDLGDAGWGVSGCTDQGLDAAWVGREACGLVGAEEYLLVEGRGYELVTNAPDRAASTGSAADGCSAGSDGLIDVCDVTLALQCMIEAAQTTCMIAQPLEAMRRALSSDTGSDFVREGYGLWAMFLASTDDCSLRDDGLFDPNATGSLGPLQPYRCFEYGMRCGDLCSLDSCDGPIPREPNLTLNDCVPLEGAAEEPSDWLVPVSDYTDFLISAYGPSIVFADVIGGPFQSGDSIMTQDADPKGVELAPSCEAKPVAAQPAIRLWSLFEQESDMIPACYEEYSDAVFLDVVADFLPCTQCRSLLDAQGEPVQVGAGPDCTATFVSNAKDDLAWELEIPACDFASKQTFSECPEAVTNPGPVRDAPCWYSCLDNSVACDASAGSGSAVQFKFCHDEACDASAQRPADVSAMLSCRASAP